MTPLMFLGVLVLGLMGAALFGYFCAPRALEQAGIEKWGVVHTGGLAIATLLTLTGLYLIFTRAF